MRRYCRVTVQQTVIGAGRRKVGAGPRARAARGIPPYDVGDRVGVKASEKQKGSARP
jgi:hypothetical protein